MASSSQAVLCRYHYDPLDRLGGTVASDLTDTQLFFQQNRLATEIQGAVQRTIVRHEDQLLAQLQRSDSASEATLLATDQQRSVFHLVDKAEVHSQAYNPYGHHPAESGLTSLLGFNGERRDPVTGHYLLGNGYRAFNPVLMRFNSPDSLSPFDEGGINAYAYCEGDPVNLGDETGHITGVFWHGLARTGIFKILLKRPTPLIDTLRRQNYLLKYQKGSTASVNVVQAPPESSHASSILRAPSPSTSRLEIVTPTGANSKRSEMLSPKLRHDAWERLTNNLRRDSSSAGQPAVARFETQRVRLHEIVYDSRILKKHYQTALSTNVNPEKHVQYIQKATRYTRLEEKYTKRAEVFLKDAETAARIRAST
jgi:RHS repeat-associated protein